MALMPFARSELSPCFVDFTASLTDRRLSVVTVFRNYSVEASHNGVQPTAWAGLHTFPQWKITESENGLTTWAE